MPCLQAGPKSAPEATSDAAVTLLSLRGARGRGTQQPQGLSEQDQRLAGSGLEDAGGTPALGLLPISAPRPASLVLTHSGVLGLPARGRLVKGTDLKPAVKFRATDSCRRREAVLWGAACLSLLLMPRVGLVRAGTGREPGCKGCRPWL